MESRAHSVKNFRDRSQKTGEFLPRIQLSECMTIMLVDFFFFYGYCWGLANGRIDEFNFKDRTVPGLCPEGLRANLHSWVNLGECMGYICFLSVNGDPLSYNMIQCFHFMTFENLIHEREFDSPQGVKKRSSTMAEWRERWSTYPLRSVRKWRKSKVLGDSTQGCHGNDGITYLRFLRCTTVPGHWYHFQCLMMNSLGGFRIIWILSMKLVVFSLYPLVWWTDSLPLICDL